MITNAAGCGSGMREYPLLLAGEPDEGEARSFAERVVDVSVFLEGIGLVDPPAPAKPLRIAYHDACHLAHAQGVRDAPRRLLAAAGHEVITPAEWEICCGSAGTYNLERPGTSAELGRRKAGNLLATGADVVAAGNIGCLVQIRTISPAMGAAGCPAHAPDSRPRLPPSALTPSARMCKYPRIAETRFPSFGISRSPGDRPTPRRDRRRDGMREATEERTPATGPRTT